MTDASDGDNHDHRATTRGHRNARAEALEKALRDNLRRRKAAQTAAPQAEEKPADPSE